VLKHGDEDFMHQLGQEGNALEADEENDGEEECNLSHLLYPPKSRASKIPLWH